MPRKLRVEFPGAIYHLMSRGDRREDIFRDDVDRQDFLKTLAEACQKTGFQVHAYCVMGNHPAIAHGRQDKERRKAQYSNDKAVLLISIVPFIFGMTLVPKAIHSLATFGRAPLNTKVGARPLSPKSSAPVLIA